MSLSVLSKGGQEEAYEVFQYASSVWGVECTVSRIDSDETLQRLHHSAPLMHTVGYDRCE